VRFSEEKKNGGQEKTVGRKNSFCGRRNAERVEVLGKGGKGDELEERVENIRRERKKELELRKKRGQNKSGGCVR